MREIFSLNEELLASQKGFCLARYENKLPEVRNFQ